MDHRNSTKSFFAGCGALLAACLLLLALVVQGCSSSDSSTATPAVSSQRSSESSSTLPAASNPQEAAASMKPGYTKKDIENLKHTENFAKGAIAHIFDGTINKKGKATGYHYSMVKDSKGHILDGTRSAPDPRGVFTAKVEIGTVKKNGFSSFYPEAWSPQDVVDAINEAYKDALSNPGNPHGDLWIGYCGDLEINMYLNDKKEIITAYPIYMEKKR